ncbi:MAG: hypothetical protein M3Q89_03575, partial [Verrucomicrobiota bacterium]|nr:hypothetical protein [Verrucomicrobiota bacterium]
MMAYRRTVSLIPISSRGKYFARLKANETSKPRTPGISRPRSKLAWRSLKLQTLTWLARYVEAPYTDAFEVGSTFRQLTEVWQLSTDANPGTKLLPILRATLLSREGGQIEVTRQELRNDARTEVKTDYEKVFGNDSFLTYKKYMEGGHHCGFVARIGRDSAQGDGTGFAVTGSDLC